MNNKKIHLPTLLILGIFVTGSLKSFILPTVRLFFPNQLTFIRIPSWIGLDARLFPVTVFGVIPFVGVLAYLLGGKRFTRRTKFSRLMILGFVFLFAAFLAPVERMFFHPSFSWQAVRTELYNLSETPLWALAFGLALVFYELEREKDLLKYFIPMAFLWVMFLIGFFVMSRAVTAPMGFPTYDPNWYLDAWFWSDQLFDFPWGAFVFWVFLKDSKILKRDGC